MPNKTGLDLFKKERFKSKVMRANQIHIQLQALEKLSKKPMTSAELRDFIESLGGEYYLLLPHLKNTGLLKIGKENNGKRGSCFVYSLKGM